MKIVITINTAKETTESRRARISETENGRKFSQRAIVDKRFKQPRYKTID